MYKITLVGKVYNNNKKTVYPVIKAMWKDFLSLHTQTETKEKDKNL